MPLFQYSPLGDPHSQIRLLDLLPGSGISPVRCHLRTVELATARGTYEPLSYCWKAPTRYHNTPTHIKLNDQRVAVGGNLWLALRELRQRRPSDGLRTLWVDAVCINQADVEEKNAQVQLMRYIYEKGRCTLIWLGAPPRPSIGRSFRMLESLARFGEDYPGESVSLQRLDEVEGYPIERQSQHRHDDAGLFFKQFRESMAFQALKHLLNEKYFFRVWIIQEVAVSQAAIILYKNHMVSWDTFERAISVLEIAELNPINALIKERDNFCLSAPESLASIVRRALSTSATNPRDKIYALLGLVNPNALAIPIEVDYGMAPVDTFRNFTRNCLHATGDAGMLAGSIGCENPGLFTPLPSWAWLPVDSFGASSPDSLFAWDPENRNPKNFRASGTSTCSPVFDNEGKVLGLSGYEIDSVEAVAPSMKPFDTVWLGDTELGANMVCTYLRWRQVAQVGGQHSYRGSNEMIEDAFRKLIPPIHDGEPTLSDEEHRALWGHFDAFIWSHFSYLERVPSRFIFTCCTLQLLVLSYKRFFLGLKGAAVLDRQDDILQTDKRCLVRTRTGHLALAPALTKPGDRVFLVEGSRAPFILRKGGDERWKLVGDCHVYNLMSGEAWDETRCVRVWIE